MLVNEIFIRSLVEKYDLNPVYSNGGMEYPKVCNISGWKYYLYSHLEKIFIEMVIQFFRDRSESFDDYYPRSKKDKCNLEYVYNSIELFVSMYNNTIINKIKVLC